MAARVTYFDMTGLGEPVRLMCAASGVTFEDIRLNKSQWEQLKPKLTWPHLPMLELDGLTLWQSRAICRYLAARSRDPSLLPATPALAALADMTVDTLDDMRQRVVKAYYVPDSPERDAALLEAKDEIIPFYLEKFEKQVQENGGFLVDGKLSWADVMLFGYSDYLSYIVKSEILANYPGLNGVTKKVQELPGVKKWILSRPQSIPDYRVHFLP